MSAAVMTPAATVAAALAAPAPAAAPAASRATIISALGHTPDGVNAILSSRAVAPYTVLSAAKSFTNVPEQGADNHGQMVEIFLHGVGAVAGEPWCAAFVHHVGHWALWNTETEKSAWPLPATAACAELGAFAEQHGILHTVPKVGAAWVMYFPEHKRFAHTGFVYAIEADGTILTVEGNTNDDGSRNGWKVAIKERTLDPARGHRFIHWMDLLPA